MLALEVRVPLGPAPVPGNGRDRPEGPAGKKRSADA